MQKKPPCEPRPWAEANGKGKMSIMGKMALTLTYSHL
jgi:hypothetical protein